MRRPGSSIIATTKPHPETLAQHYRHVLMEGLSHKQSWTYVQEVTAVKQLPPRHRQHRPARCEGGACLPPSLAMLLPQDNTDQHTARYAATKQQQASSASNNLGQQTNMHEVHRGVPRVLSFQRTLTGTSTEPHTGHSDNDAHFLTAPKPSTWRTSAATCHSSFILHLQQQHRAATQQWAPPRRRRTGQLQGGEPVPYSAMRKRISLHSTTIAYTCTKMLVHQHRQRPRRLVRSTAPA